MINFASASELIKKTSKCSRQERSFQSHFYLLAHPSALEFLFCDDIYAVGESSNHNRQFELQAPEFYWVTNTLQFIPVS